MKKYKAIIYDMDGVLIDSVLYWKDVDREFFSSRNIPYKPEYSSAMNGGSQEGNAMWLKETFKLPEPLEEILKHKISLSDAIYTQKSNFLPGADKLLELGKRLGHKQAIASGSSIKRIKIIVDRFGWTDYLHELISSDHVNCAGKPKPDIYLHTAKILDINPEECVVLEDSENGIKAAKAAGMSCVAVPDPRWSNENYDEADFRAASLEDLNLYKFLGL